METNARRLQELGRVDAGWVSAVLGDLAGAEADPRGVMVTPLVLEIVALRR